MGGSVKPRAAINFCCWVLPCTLGIGCSEHHIIGDNDARQDVTEDPGDVLQEEIPGLPECTTEQMQALEEEVMRLAPEGDSCFTGSVIVSNDGVVVSQPQLEA
jgi:hypothetical protein